MINLKAKYNQVLKLNDRFCELDLENKQENQRNIIELLRFERFFTFRLDNVELASIV